METDAERELRQATWIAVYSSTLSIAGQDERKRLGRWLTTVEMWILRAGAAAFADAAVAKPEAHSSGSNAASSST